LLISRQIIEAHGGQLEVSNSSEGGGRVEVRLPIQLTQT
jgi:signal transduction histidine kinase